jgi:hypothetical protein
MAYIPTGWFLEGMFNIADVFISIFIIAYAIFFLSRTHPTKTRRPWEIMLISIVFFLLAAVFTVLGQFNIVYIQGLISFLKTIFIGLMLLVFTMTIELLKDAEITIKKK